MAGLEEEIFEKSHFQSHIWLRYLHDIFGIWTGGLENLKEFFGFSNNVDTSIKLPWGIAKNKLIFKMY